MTAELFSFGQFDRRLVQVAYTVADIESEMRRYSETLGVGPWFLVGPFTPTKAMYRGKPGPMTISLAVAFAGPVMMELIQQHDDAPSVFRETLEARGTHGFHHWAIGARDFNATVAEYKSKGYAEVFSDISPRGVRIVYVDTSAHLPGMLEIIEMTPDVEAQYREMRDAAEAWDGKTHIVHRRQPKRPADSKPA